MERKPLHLSLLCGKLGKTQTNVLFVNSWCQTIKFSTSIPSSTLDVDKFGGLPSCITTFCFIFVPIERLRVVNNILHAFGMWSSSSSSRSYIIFIHNFMKVSIEPSSFVMTPLCLDTKFSWLLKSYKCCLSQHVKNANQQANLHNLILCGLAQVPTTPE